MDANKALERFCYLGTLLPVYEKKKGHIPPAIFNQLSPYISQVNASIFLSIVEKCLNHKCLIRKEELWFMYVTYLSSDSVNNDDKQKVKIAFHKYAKDAEDLFLFAKYSKMIMKYKQKNGFSKTIRKAIALWYKEQSTSQLIEMLACNRGLHGFTHQDLVTLCHVNLKALGKEDVFNILFRRCNYFAKIDENNLSEAPRRFVQISKLKICQDVAVAKNLIKENKLKYEHVPCHLLKVMGIWSVLLPQMSYTQILRSIPFLTDCKMFNNLTFAKRYAKILEHKESMREARIHPLEYLIERNKQSKLCRYSEVKKQRFYGKKVEKFRIKNSKVIREALEMSFLNSFNYVQSIGLRICITINLQRRYRNRPVISQKQINCFEAAITLAYSYFISEKNCDVFTYTPDPSVLIKIPWDKENIRNYNDAEKICAHIMSPKNRQQSYLPIIEANKNLEKYDLFLTIVPSIARGNPSNSDDKILEYLQHYENDIEVKTKMVFVNLSRYKPAMIHTAARNNRILEICGVNENTPKLINSFATNLFS